LSLKNYVINK